MPVGPTMPVELMAAVFVQEQETSKYVEVYTMVVGTAVPTSIPPVARGMVTEDKEEPEEAVAEAEPDRDFDMAILEDVPGIEVAITVNGNDLKEHEEDDTVNEPKTVTKYIEATSGVNFGSSGDLRVEEDNAHIQKIGTIERVRKRKDLTGSVVEALKNLRIIGRTPMPVPLEECPLEELSADQLREIIRQKKDEMLRRIKPEGLERKTKREGSENGASQRKKPRIAPEYLEIDDDGTVREIKPPTQTAIRESFGR
ncbi:hypothetical protein B0A49_01332 [Cryomyces minteri]|uniref:DUF7918 domain-containing protein n=1 Tax=Cryomyces minteri TaxID=331657 RepID=A0A4U0XP40_9PEZI|nr:hypothetical protein B0A49_01332 [Cryomyces minteri]